MTVQRFVAGNETYTFPQPIDSDSNNFYNLVTRAVRLPGVSGGFDTRGSNPNEKENGNLALTYHIKHGWAKTTYSETDPDIAMRKAMDAVHRLAYVGRGKLYKTFGKDANGDPDERWMWGKISNITMPTNQSRPSNLWQPVRMNFSSALPFWFKSGTEAVATWGSFVWGDGTAWGGSAPAQAVNGIATLWGEEYVNGIAPTLVRISIIAGANGITNPKIERWRKGVLQDQVVWTGTMTEGQELEINCRAKQVQLDGVDAYDNFSYATPSWLRLLPGGNTIFFRSANGTDEGDVYLRYYEVY